MVQAHTRCERMTSPASTGSSGPHFEAEIEPHGRVGLPEE
jgi:hypothetical protein